MLTNDSSPNRSEIENATPAPSAAAEAAVGGLQQESIANTEAVLQYRYLDRLVAMLNDPAQRSSALAEVLNSNSSAREELASKFAERMEPSASFFSMSLSYNEAKIRDTLSVLKDLGSEGVSAMLAPLDCSPGNTGKLYFEIRSRFGTSPYPRCVGEVLGDVKYREQVIQTVMDRDIPIERAKLGQVMLAAFARDIIPNDQMTDFDRTFLKQVLADKSQVRESDPLTVSDYVVKLLTYAPRYGDAMTSAWGNPIYPPADVCAHARSLYRELKDKSVIEDIYYRALKIVGL